MQPLLQIALGAGIGIAVWKAVLEPRTTSVEANPKRKRRKKKFVRVRGHMRCMPKKHKKPEPEIIIIEREVERRPDPEPEPEPSFVRTPSLTPTPYPVPASYIPETVVQAAPVVLDEPTIEDMQEQNATREGFPWRVAAGATAVGAAIALIASAAYQSTTGGQP